MFLVLIYETLSPNIRSQTSFGFYKALLVKKLTYLFLRY